MAFRVRKSITWLPFETGGTDAHGNPVEGYGDPQDFPVYGYGPRAVDSQPAEPGRSHRDLIIVGLSVYAPTNTAVSPHDRFIVDGETFEVDGEIGLWDNGPFGWDPGMSINLTRKEG